MAQVPMAHMSWGHHDFMSAGGHVVEACEYIAVLSLLNSTH